MAPPAPPPDPPPPPSSPDPPPPPPATTRHSIAKLESVFPNVPLEVNVWYLYPPADVMLPPDGKAMIVLVTEFDDTLPSELTTSILITVPAAVL